MVVVLVSRDLRGLPIRDSMGLRGLRFGILSMALCKGLKMEVEEEEEEELGWLQGDSKREVGLASAPPPT